MHLCCEFLSDVKNLDSDCAKSSRLWLLHRCSLKKVLQNLTSEKRLICKYKVNYDKLSRKWKKRPFDVQRGLFLWQSSFNGRTSLRTWSHWIKAGDYLYTRPLLSWIFDNQAIIITRVKTYQEAWLHPCDCCFRRCVLCALVVDLCCMFSQMFYCTRENEVDRVCQ